jgi:pyruvate/2-oxoglutarate dehydrogenase complex dihydrolipoamide dehydrogenase (E3) component
VEIVHEVVVAKTAGLTVADLAHTTHAHPTVSEVIKIAASSAAAQCS